MMYLESGKLPISILQKKERITNYHIKEHCLYSLKIFIPEYSLAFEFQGEYHFHNVPIYNSRQSQQIKDKKKLELSERMKSCFFNMKELGITLICIPFWWDKSLVALAKAIREKRADVPLSVP